MCSKVKQDSQVLGAREFWAKREMVMRGKRSRVYLDWVDGGRQRLGCEMWWGTVQQEKEEREREEQERMVREELERKEREREERERVAREEVLFRERAVRLRDFACELAMLGNGWKRDAREAIRLGDLLRGDHKELGFKREGVIDEMLRQAIFRGLRVQGGYM